jgi:ParB family transcriptional regulator, chromosome partitioning protein
MLASLTENLARRQHATIELVRDISRMKEAGCSLAEIARRTDLHATYVRAILQLLAKGEERLLQAMEKGQLPVNIAIIIATANDKAVQQALQESYEKNDLRGKSLLRARRLIENRRANGKCSRRGQRRREPSATAGDLLKTFQTETIRQKMIIQKAKVHETRLFFAVSAVRQLFQDENFVTLLRAEGLDSLPGYLAEQIGRSEVAA